MNNTKKTSSDDSISWKTEDFKRQPKNKFWYFGFVVVAIGLIAFGIYLDSIITIIAFSLSIIAILIVSFQNPRLVTYKLTKTGIVIDKSTYPYKNIRKFWILYYPPTVTTLNFETTAYLNNQVSIELGSQNPLDIKTFLQNYLPEDLEKEESLSDVLSRKLKI
jgi:hypothetical protein